MQQMLYLKLRQSIKLLIIEYQKGHTPCEERAHFLVFKKSRGTVPQCPLFCSAAPDPADVV